MSIMDQAARRLEELKRAGFDVFNGAPPRPGMPPTSVTASSIEGRAAAAAEASGLFRNRNAVPEAAAPAAFAPAPQPSRRSREVYIDLNRLEQEGYLVPSQARSQLAEEMRIIKRPLLANARGESAQPIERPNLILVASAMPGEGKTFFAMNLAMSIAMEVDHSVLLVDADVLRPSALTRLGLEQTRGLMDVLHFESLDLGDVLLRTNVPKLSLLPAGTANAKSSELLGSAAMESLLAELAAKYSDRIVVFDAPPIIPTTETRVLASRVGQVVMVVEAEHTTHAQISQAYSALEHCPVVLSVLNKFRGKGAVTGYGYFYGA
ncbi:MAG: XrtA-associated tyrosine autokinase [Leptothrix ochracea]|uniref:XrtA-associated tyrosine autokinase n=1 Tax=Leptothrix ochracea TaxID=735331 RepID=UPI0034E22EA4